LFGSLGAGKTTFVRGVAHALGVDTALVASPTYVVIHDYPGTRLNLIHVDAYRLVGSDDLDSLGWDRAMQGEAATVIEWPERIAGALDLTSAVRVTLTLTGETSRRVTFELPDVWRSRAGIESLASPLITTCPVTGRPVPADSPTWPFADSRARMADLYRWFSGEHVLSREISEDDEDVMEAES
jgi:tRNA threonylcarbamoyladenosine biosynthesis protein TsaE